MWHHESGAEKEVAMPWLAADPVIVSPADREALEALVRVHSTSQQLALRARMILHAADNIGVRECCATIKSPRSATITYSWWNMLRSALRQSSPSRRRRWPERPGFTGAALSET